MNTGLKGLILSISVFAFVITIFPNQAAAQATGESCRIRQTFGNHLQEINLNPNGNEWLVTDANVSISPGASKWQTPVSVDIAPGRYKVYMHGHDNHSFGGLGQGLERFVVGLRTSGVGEPINEFWTVGPSVDVPENSNRSVAFIGETTISQHTRSLYARHAFPSDPNPQSLTAVCIALERIDDPVDPDPVVNLFANNSKNVTIDYGTSANLTWNTQNATACRGLWDNQLRPTQNSSGESTGNLTSTTNFTLRCANDTKTATDTVTVNVRPKPVEINNAVCRNIQAPSSVTTGQNFFASVSMDNTGTKDWSSGTGHALRSQSIDWGVGGRVALPFSPVQPGIVANFNFQATAPNTPGTYNFSWRVAEGSSQFGGICDKQIRVEGIAQDLTVTLSADPTSLDRGGRTNLTWGSTGADRCWATRGPWSGVSGTSGTRQSFNLFATEVFEVTCENSFDQKSAQVTVIVDDIQDITVSLDAFPTRVNRGETSRLTWSSTGADTCRATRGPWSGVSGTSGSRTSFNLSNTEVFEVTCSNSTQERSAQVTVFVDDAPDPTVTLTAFPTRVDSGSRTTLTWSSNNTTSCHTDGGPWSRSILATSGNQESLSMNLGAFFGIRCVGDNGQNVYARVEVEVRDTPSIDVELSASPNPVDEGEPTFLTWNSTGADYCEIDGPGFFGRVSTSGRSERSRDLFSDTDFSIECFNNSGDRASDSEFVRVRDVIDPPSVTLTANPSHVDYGGDTLLTWRSENTTSCRNSGGPWSRNISGTNGSERSSDLFFNTRFEVSCTGENGQSVFATVDVTVDPQPNRPTVVLRAEPIEVDRGGSTILTWDSTNADRCRATRGPWSGISAADGFEVVRNINNAETFEIECTGPGGTAIDDVRVTIRSGGGDDVRVFLDASPLEVREGESTRLTWTSTGADRCETSSSGWRNPGSRTTGDTETSRDLFFDTIFEIECENNEGDRDRDTVTVRVRDDSQRPVVRLFASPDRVNSGGSTTLHWDSDHAVRCWASAGTGNGWGGNLPPDGSRQVFNISQGRSFQVTCYNDDGESDNDSVFVDVFGGGGTPSVFLSASPNPVNRGQTTLLTWNSSNTTSCNQGSGPWSGSVFGTNGSANSQALFNGTTFTINCFGTNGQTVSASAFVDTFGTGSGQPSVFLTANPTVVASGNNSTLTWSSNNTTSCTASNGWSGSKLRSGSQTVGPIFGTQLYTITCFGTNGQQVSAQATVSTGGINNAPTLNLFADPSSVNQNGFSTLRWTTTNATSCTSSGAWSGNRPVNGNQTVGPLTQSSNNYIMTCSGPGGTVTRNAIVTVGSVLGNTTPVLNIHASPNPVNSGGSTTVTWSTQNVTSCFASGDWSGSKNISGNELRTNLTSSKNYTLTCSGIGGTVTRTATVPVIGVGDPKGPDGFYAADIDKTVRNLSVNNGSQSSVTAFPGNELEYTVTVRNTGTLTLRNLIVTDRLSDKVEPRSISDGGDYNIANRTVTWRISSLAPNSTKTFRLNVKVFDCECDNRLFVDNIAELSGTNITTISSNLTTAGIESYPFIVDISSPRSVVRPGDEITYVVNYRNDGNDTVNNARLDVVIPAGMRVEGHSETCTLSGNTVSLNIGTVAPGASGRIEVIASVDETVLDGEVLTTNAIVSFDGPDGRGETLSTVVTTVDNNASGGRNVAGAGFSLIPSTFWGWLLLLLIVIILAVLIRRLLSKEG